MADKPPAKIALLPQVQAILQSSYPELGAALHAVIGDVTSALAREIKGQLASAASLDDDAARDDLPEVLETLAQALQRVDSIEQLSLCGPAHAAARDGQRFTIEELFSEYVIVRCLLTRAIVARLNRPLSADEALALHVGLDGVVAATVMSFTAQREARLKLECTTLSDFLSSLAHDLRNEANGVMMTLQLLDEASDEILQEAGLAGNPIILSRLHEFVRDIRSSREMMISAVSAMTRLLEIERVRTVVHLKVREVALSPLMQGVARSASRSLRNAGVETPRGALDAVEISCPPGLILTTDPDLLGTALVNLVGNAIKHAPGAPISFKAVSLPGGRCRIEIRDGGPGIAAERIPLLFRRFERGEGSAPGAGVGLFVARRAAELLGSPITVASELGKGSCFSLELPPRPPKS